MALLRMVLVSSVPSLVFVMVMFFQNTPVQLMDKFIVLLFVVMVSKGTFSNAMTVTQLMVMGVPQPVKSNKRGAATMIQHTLVALCQAINSHSQSARSSKYPTETQ